jgi:hypothetical protein
VTGARPGEHTGICLLGIGAGVPRTDALRVRCGGGVVGRLGIAGACSTIVAIRRYPKNGIENKRRQVYCCIRERQLITKISLAVLSFSG